MGVAKKRSAGSSAATTQRSHRAGVRCEARGRRTLARKTGRPEPTNHDGGGGGVGDDGSGTRQPARWPTSEVLQRRCELGLLGPASCRLSPKLLSALSKLLLRRCELGLLGLASCRLSSKLLSALGKLLSALGKHHRWVRSRRGVGTSVGAAVTAAAVGASIVPVAVLVTGAIELRMVESTSRRSRKVSTRRAEAARRRGRRSTSLGRTRRHRRPAIQQAWTRQGSNHVVAEAHPLDCGPNSGIPKSSKALLQPTHALLLWFPNAAKAATRQPENCGGGIGTQPESIGVAKETRRGPVHFEPRIVLPPLFLPSQKRRR